MNFFIDFEATQFSNEIISIGCVSENNERFYSQVKAKKKISPFITSLTGITDQENKEAPESDVVFSEFFDWISQFNDKVIFYCYGNTDISFVKRNLEGTKNIKAQAALSLIGMNLYDYSKTVKNHFGLIKNISLIKIVSYYRNTKELVQLHNALDDALFLKEVYENIIQENEVVGHPFPEYETLQDVADVYKMTKNELKNVRHKIFVYNQDGVLVEDFQSLGEARNWIYNQLGKVDKAVADKRKIENKIINAFLTNKTYKGYKWKIIVLKEN